MDAVACNIVVCVVFIIINNYGNEAREQVNRSCVVKCRELRAAATAASWRMRWGCSWSVLWCAVAVGSLSGC